MKVTRKKTWTKIGSPLPSSRASSRNEISITGGQLCLKVNPPQQGYPEYIIIDGTDDEFLGTDDDEFVEMMDQFLYESQKLKATKFVLELIKFEEDEVVEPMTEKIEFVTNVSTSAQVIFCFSFDS